MAAKGTLETRQIYDHYWCNFELFDKPISSTFDDECVEKIIFIHGRCKGDLVKPQKSYAPLLKSILANIKSNGKKAVIYMPAYHEYVGLEAYEPWSLETGVISREIRDCVEWQITKWNEKRFSFITNSWGCWQTMKLLKNEQITKYVDKVVFIAPVFNCWMIEENEHLILTKNENDIKILAVYGSNDMQTNNDCAKGGGVKRCLSRWFDERGLNVECIEGGTHGGIYDKVPNAKWNGRKWTIGASVQKYYDLFGCEEDNDGMYKDKTSKYEEPELPKDMNHQQYRDAIAEKVGSFLFTDDRKTKGNLMTALNLIQALISEFQ